MSCRRNRGPFGVTTVMGTLGRLPIAFSAAMVLLLPGAAVPAAAKGEPDAAKSVAAKGAKGAAKGEARSEPSKTKPRSQPEPAAAEAEEGDEGSEADQQEEGAAPPPLPPGATYRVKKGDTLWDICQAVFNDPWQWPRIWSLNPQVTNPHWIFPDDIIALDKGAPTPTPIAAAQPEQKLPAVQVADTGPLGTRIREVGFVSDSELKQAGKIEGSPEEKIMLTAGDIAYARTTNEQPLKLGVRYTIYTVDWKSPVKDPKTGKLYGYIVQIHGEYDVTSADPGEMARGMLVGLRGPIERGFMVGPIRHPFRRVPPRIADKSIKAQIVAALQPNWLIAREMFVVLNLGRNAGVQEGTRFFIHRRGDGYGTVLGGWNVQDPRFPEEKISELLIVLVQDEVSIAWVSNGKREIAVGEYAEARPGS